MTAAGSAVGVLGGTFDPVHLGHLALAEEVRRCLGLVRVMLTPTALPPHKTGAELSPPFHREAMLRLALADRQGLELCSLELRPDRISYTIDTLRALRCGPPPLRPVFILGADSLLQIHTWRDHVDLIAEFDLVVVDRGEDEMDTVIRLLSSEIANRIVALPRTPSEIAGPAADDPGRGGRIFHLAMAPIAISSSAIRRRAREGLDLTGLVPPPVAEYIDRTGLYRQEIAR